MSGESPRRLPRKLAIAIAELDKKQQQAVLHRGSCVVVAGPGSGKTETLVTKVGVLLASDVSPTRGVACITYTNQAALQVSRRLARLGVHRGDRLACATVHSWCLNEILRKYRSLHGVPLADPISICSEETSKDIAERSLLDAEASFTKVDWEMTTLTKIRRALAASEDVSGFETKKVAAAAAYEVALVDAGLIDYESMVGRALQALLQTPELAHLIAARYPWLVVDEYQDLGPVLHRIVTLLHDTAGVQIFCVGDPDQSVMGFTGADPRYLLELEAETRSDILPIRLVRNHRSGSAILAAAELALGEKRGYETARPDQEGGTVEEVPVEGGLDDHARVVAEKIASSLAAGIPAHEIAVLYPARGSLPDEIVKALVAAGIDFLHERDQKIPGGPLMEFIRSCAARTVAGPQSCGWQDTVIPTAPVLTDIAHEYIRILTRAGIKCPSFFGASERLQVAIDGSVGQASPDGCLTWLDGLIEALSLDEVAANSEDQRDRTALEQLRQAVGSSGLRLADLASGIVEGKVVLTTYHNSKGREFDLMILPGLVEGVMPRLDYNPSHRRYDEPAPAVIAEARRTFYVGLTRGRAGIVLIYGPGYFNNGGFWVPSGPSRFVIEILENRLRPEV
jgi:DNA helicase-2/ATP-dependent DNA helicase PcrA